MPLVEITVSSGRPPEKLRELMAQVHAAVENTLGSPAQSIRVIVREVPPQLWSAGGVTLAEKAAGTAP